MCKPTLHSMMLHHYPDVFPKGHPKLFRSGPTLHEFTSSAVAVVVSACTSLASCCFSSRLSFQPSLCFVAFYLESATATRTLCTMCSSCAQEISQCHAHCSNEIVVLVTQRKNLRLSTKISEVFHLTLFSWLSSWQL